MNRRQLLQRAGLISGLSLLPKELRARGRALEDAGAAPGPTPFATTITPFPGGTQMLLGGTPHPSMNSGDWNTITLNVAAGRFAFIFQVPKSGVLNRFGFRMGINQAPTGGLKFSFQDIVVAGNPDLVVDQYGVVPVSGTATGWVEPTDYLGSTGLGSGTKRTVVEGDWIGCVVEFAAFVTGDSIFPTQWDFGGLVPYNAQAYMSNYNGTAWGKNGSVPRFGLRYDDGTYAPVCSYWWPSVTFNASTINNSTTPDEVGLKFQVPAPCQLGGAWLQSAVSNDSDLVLYDPSGVVLLTHAMLAANSQNNAMQITRFARFPAVQLQPNVNYRLTMRPQSGSNATLYDHTIPSAAHLGGFDGGPTWMFTSRTDAGLWTDTPTRRPAMGLILNGLPSGSVADTFVPWLLLSHTAAVGTASAVTTPAIDTRGANLIVVISGGQLVLAPTDSLGNTNWFSPRQQPSASGYGLWISFITNPITGAAHTFTLSGGGSAYPSLAVLAFKGAFGGAETVVGAYVAGANIVQPGAITPSALGALLVTGYSNSSGTTAPAITAPFTLVDSVPAAAAGGPIAAAYYLPSTVAAANPIWSSPGGAVGGVSQMIAFLLRTTSGAACASGGILPYTG